MHRTRLVRVGFAARKSSQFVGSVQLAEHPWSTARPFAERAAPWPKWSRGDSRVALSKNWLTESNHAAAIQPPRRAAAGKPARRYGDLKC